MVKKIPVGLLGATGVVGQQYLKLLAEHPWFQVTFIASSEQSAGKSYQEAVKGRWYQHSPIPNQLATMKLNVIDAISEAKERCRFVFSALTTEAAKIYEEKYAEAGLPVVSNASYHRFSNDVPLLIPEINTDHLRIISMQQRNRNWKDGFIVVKPNCSLQSYMIPLHPLHMKFGVKKLIITTLQAVSGAGYPGVSSIDMIDNIIPYIAKEEEKSEIEPLKIWGAVDNGYIKNAEGIAISAHCNRVPVLDGHMACVSIQFENKPSQTEILALWKNYPWMTGSLSLPSAPVSPVVYREEADRPQPRLDRHEGNGMAITVGRLRPCPVFDYRFVALSHNTLRGAAGGGVLNAELLVSQKYLD